MTVRDRVKELRRVRAGELRRNPRNWRLHPEVQKTALRSILLEVGYGTALVARELEDGTLELIDGHLRADLDPDQVVPVLILDVDEAEARKLLATMDPLSAMATGDPQSLAGLLDSISTDNTVLGQLLRDIREDFGAFADVSNPNLEDAGPRITEAEQLRDEWGVERGQLWELGEHRLLCGDSTSPQDVGRVMGGQGAALLSTDPPYCVDYTGNDRPVHDGRPSGKDWSAVYREVDIKDLGQFMDGVFSAVLPHVNVDAGIYVWHAHTQQPTIAAVFERHNLLLHQILIWVKPVATFGHSYYRWKHEPCAFGWHRGHKPAHGFGQLDSVWEVDFEGKARAHGNQHPTQKPLRLFEIPMEVHTKPGDVVLEPFSGSGSQLIAAEKLRRKCRAIEISPPFVAVALQRWADTTGGTPRRLE